jgi:hypothetical protein
VKGIKSPQIGCGKSGEQNKAILQQRYFLTEYIPAG